jgi:hypothetical protein
MSRRVKNWAVTVIVLAAVGVCVLGFVVGLAELAALLGKLD